MPVAPTRIALTIQGMPRSDDGRTNILPIRVADPDPSVVRAVTIQLAVHRTSAEKIEHPPLGILTSPTVQFGRVHTV